MIKAPEFVGYVNRQIIASGHGKRRLTMVVEIAEDLNAHVRYVVTEIGRPDEPIAISTSLENAVKVYNHG